MNANPSVCIIIPTYNQQQFIKKAVNSALSQNYDNVQIIVVDDYSNDNTENILKEFKDLKRFSYHKNKTNVGRVANYHNALYNLTSADWIINLDGDDYFTNNNFIAVAIENIQKVGIGEVFFYQGGHSYVSESIKKICIPKIKTQSDVYNCENYFLKFFEFSHFSHMATVYKRSLAIESNFYALNITSSDIYSFLNCCLYNLDKKVILSKEIAGVWLQHGNNASKSISRIENKKNKASYLKLYKTAKELCLDNALLKKWYVTILFAHLKQNIKTWILNFK